MTNERDTKEGDKLVSETYRELADEQTPEHLNRAVLQMAAGKSTHGNALRSVFAIWMKPVAWAATIALSLAVVLEFTDLPSELSQPASLTPARESLKETFSPKDADILDKAEQRALLQDGPDSVADSELKAPVELTEFETKGNVMPFSAAAPGTNQPSAKKQRLRDDALAEMDAAVPVRREAAPTETPSAARSLAQSEAQSEAPSEMPALEEIIIEQSADFAITTDDYSPAEIASTTAIAAGLSASKVMADSVSECTPVARLAVQSWLECIASLRAAGASEVADIEYQAFSDEYPAESAEIEANK